MNIRKVKYFYKNGDHACDVVNEAIEKVGMENPEEYNTHDFWHLDEELFGYMKDKYPHDNVPCMYYKDTKIFEAEPGMSDEDLVRTVRSVYDQIKDLSY